MKIKLDYSYLLICPKCLEIKGYNLSSKDVEVLSNTVFCNNCHSPAEKYLILQIIGKVVVVKESDKAIWVK